MIYEYVCSAPVLVDSNVFWMFVVTMPLNMKSSFCNKIIGVLFCSKSMDDDIQTQVKSLYCAPNKCRGTFVYCSSAVKLFTNFHFSSII